MILQTLELSDVLFPSLLRGEKNNTLRWNEGDIKEGYLIFYATTNPEYKALVWVTNVQNYLMPNIAPYYKMSAEELHISMLKHYPDIKIDSEVARITYLSPRETNLKYGQPEGLNAEFIIE